MENIQRELKLTDMSQTNQSVRKLGVDDVPHYFKPQKRKISQPHAKSYTSLCLLFAREATLLSIKSFFLQFDHIQVQSTV